MVFRPGGRRPRRFVLAPGNEIQRGRAAKKGPVSWTQDADDEWERGYKTRNRYPPFLPYYYWLWAWRFAGPPERVAEVRAIREEINRLNEERDWRKVSQDFLDRMESVANDLYRYAKWDLSGGKEGEKPGQETIKAPYMARGMQSIRAFAEIGKCWIIARRRLEETFTLGVRKDMEARRISEKVDPEESKRRAEAWVKDHPFREEGDGRT